MTIHVSDRMFGARTLTATIDGYTYEIPQAWIVGFTRQREAEGFTPKAALHAALQC